MLAQQNDSSKTIHLNEINISDHQHLNEIQRLPDLKDNVIYSAKKTEVIVLDKINADLSTNNTRQVFRKVPGVSVWENDGSGIQVGVASRGLSPNRSWEFNVRQNGYDISAEAFGYPESYYSPPMEALEKIELVRGAASLQFGPQFGGLLNYQFKKANPNKPISFESQQTFGSYGLYNTYNAIGRTHKKFSYYGFIHHRSADGWRKNSYYDIYTGYISLNYQITKRISLGAEYTKMDYKSQQPGGLTDAQFAENHRQSGRERNWFGTPWNVASIQLKYEISPSVNFSLKTFTTIAERNSVGNAAAINKKDSINPSTLQYAARQLDRDWYNNLGAEARFSVKYEVAGRENVLAGGVRAYYGHTERKQKGKGTVGSDFDLQLLGTRYLKELEFQTYNYALFAEHIFQISEKLKIVPGFRYEFISNSKEGYIDTSKTGAINSEKRIRAFPLYGIGSEFKVSEKTNLYANYSRAYRPVTFSELTPSATNEIIDEKLKDASGFNVDLGYRGNIKRFLTFDLGVFYLNYDNRIGTINQNGNPFKTNIGTSVSKGIESFVEINPLKIFTEESPVGDFSLFASNSFIDARYVKWNDPSKAVKDKRVENAPQQIHRFGVNYFFKGFSATFQFSSVGDVFTDAENNINPNSTSTTGKLNGYQVMDFSFSFRFFENYQLKAGVNNLANEKYATRRSGGYPGPGILPGMGRTYFVTFGITL